MKSHRTDVVSLLFGLLFVALASWWAASYYLNWALTWHVPHFGWFAAGGLILLGLLGVVASLRRDRQEPLPVEGDRSWADTTESFERVEPTFAGGESTLEPFDSTAERADPTTDLGPPPERD
jgi:hypothetical protein